MKAALIYIIIFTVAFCSPKKKFPPQVSTKAIFDKKINLYSATENGLQLKWYDTGELYSTCKVSPLGIFDGEYIQYSKNKIILSKGIFKNGQRDGLWVWNFLDGGIYYKQHFTYGKKRVYWIQTDIWGNEDGIYERYYDNGQLEEKGFFEEGYKVGRWEKYFRNRKLEYSGTYLKDKKIKDWKFYYPTGSIEARERYDDSGKLISRITYFEDGKTQCTISDDKAVKKCL